MLEAQLWTMRTSSWPSGKRPLSSLHTEPANSLRLPGCSSPSPADGRAGLQGGRNKSGAAGRPEGGAGLEGAVGPMWGAATPGLGCEVLGFTGQGLPLP